MALLTYFIMSCSHKNAAGYANNEIHQETVKIVTDIQYNKIIK